MSNPLPSREQAITILRQQQCPRIVIRHCIAVAKLAVETANRLQAKGIRVNSELVEVGALLHDLGRSKSNTVDHAVIGAQIAQDLGLPEAIIRIIQRHVGGGITVLEAEAFGWPKGTYFPESLEEKIVSYADKLTDKGGQVPITVEVERLQNVGKAEAAERVRRLYDEISSLLVSP